MLRSLKSYLIQTPLYPVLLQGRSFFQYFYVKLLNEPRAVNTVYCISPYKTGTTYFSGLFDCKSEHEPLMHATITHMDDMNFLAKRASSLSLDLECSGFFADKISVVRKFAPDSRIVFLSRHPESWIGSVVNYFAKLDSEVSFNYVARLIFDPICHYPVESFYSLSHEEQPRIVKSLLEYWIQVYSSAEKDDLALVVPLDELVSRKLEVESFIGFEMKLPENIWKRENQNKRAFSLADYMDLSPYRGEVRNLGYEI